MAGYSFTVNNKTNRLNKWKQLLNIRYFQHLGTKDSFNVTYKTIRGNEKIVIEERYKINTTGKEKLSLSITIYDNTGRILIQGNSKKQWIENEFDKMKKIIDLGEDIKINYLKVYNVTEQVLDEAANDNDTYEQVVKEFVAEVINKAIDEEEEEEEEEEEREKEKKTIENKLIDERKVDQKKVDMSAKKSKSKMKVGKQIEEKKNKVDQIQIKNNKNTIENIETFLVEIQENYDNKLSKMGESIREMRKKYDKEITEIKKENELAVAFADKQLSVTKKIESERLMKEQGYEKEVKEKDKEIMYLKEKIRDMEIIIRNNKKNIEMEVDNRLMQMKVNIADNTAKINNTKKKDVIDNIKERVKKIETKMELTTDKKRINDKDNVPTISKYDHKKQADTEKQVINEEVVIIMDSNRRHINKERFWNGHSCKILKAGDVYSARKVIKENSFKNARFIYIHIGTNDIERMESIDDTAKDIINVGKMAKESNPNANIIISEIPVRNDFFNQNRIEVNNLMEKSMPESIIYVKHDNIKKEMLVDKKHISERYIHNLVRNMKNKLREILKIKGMTNINYNNNGLQKEGKNMNFNMMNMQKKISSLVDYLTNF